MLKIALFIVILIANTLAAQNFDWLKGFGSKTRNESLLDLKIDALGNCTFLLNFSEGITTNLSDSLKLDSINFFLSPTTQRGIYVVTLNKGGFVQNAKHIGNFVGLKLIQDKNRFNYISGILTDTNYTQVDGVKLDVNKGRFIILKLDSLFNKVWLFQDGIDSVYLKGGGGGLFDNNKSLFISDDNQLLFSFLVYNKTILGDSIYKPIATSSVYGAIEPNSGELIWSKALLSKNADITIYISNIIKLNNKIYFSGNCQNRNNPNSQMIINNDTFIGRESFIIQSDSFGNYFNKFRISNNKFLYINSMTCDKENLYFGGAFIDTLSWNSNVIPPQLIDYPPKLSYSSIPYLQLFVASVSSNLNPRWFYRPEIKGKTITGNPFGSVCNIFCIDGFIYTSSLSGGDIIIEGNELSKEVGALVMKFDERGNILWYKKGGLINWKYVQTTIPIGGLEKKYVFIGGNFIDSTRFGKLLITNNGIGLGTWDAFLTRLSDNAIIRGAISAGPYCAGDTFKVPYKKIGDYDTSNYFIAELSDADGNFNGEHRELGRIKTNKDSVVLGKLPLFQVASSEKYRIRILSTAPAVQSYYKVDTLRLLIYSKDKADAGRDTLICKGDSLKLQTFGGTKWTWSPKYKMFDSTARETMVWPDKTTTYTIIIADSSGCGQADTTSKTVFIRKELSVQFHTPKDTNVCLNGTMPLVVSFHGGDSTAYNWQWTAIDSKNNYYFPQSGSGKQRDTLLYTLPTTEKDSIQFSIFLSDGCTPKPAFGLYTLKVKKNKTTTTFKENDTSICPGKMLPVISHFTGSSAALLSWQWQEANTANQWINRKAASNKQADTFNYTLPLNWKGNKRLRVILKDNCSGLNDTAVYTITPRDTLQLKLNTNDTTLCKGQTYTYKAIAKDGYSEGYQFVWIDTQTGDTLSVVDSLRVIAQQNQNIKVTLKDGCMPNAINRTFNVTVNPELSSEIRLNNTKANDTLLCYGQSIEYQAQTTGGIGVYRYSWKLNGTEISTQNSLQITKNDYKQLAGSTIRLQLIISDGCTVVNDSNELNIEILEPIIQTTNYQDSICFESSANFKTTAQGGLGNFSYKWIDNSNTTISTLDNYIFTHNTNQTGTNTLKAIVSDGCSKSDTSEINTVLLAPLNVSISASDPCPVNALTLTANVTGGKTTSRQINWFENSSPIGTGNSITLNTLGIPKTITAIVTDACSKSDTQSFSTGSRPGIKLETNNICLGDETNILTRSTNASKADTYQWKIDGAIQTQTDSILKQRFTEIGKYKILVTASNNGTCQGLDSINLEILPKPEAAFDYIHFKSQGNLIPFKFNNRSQKESNWYWDFGTGDTSMIQDPNYNYTDTGKFWVQLIVGKQGKCFDTTRQLIPVYHDIAFYFPNVFSPNGNSINETFGLSAGQWFKVSTYTLKIYNRWGELVFSTDQMQEQWTGEGAQQSVYIFTVEIRDVYNVLHKIEGGVELLK